MLRPVLLCIVLLHCFNISSAIDEESSSCQAATTLSCEDIKNYWPESSSGYYSIVSSGNERRYMYCDMEELELGEECGSGGGWTRLAHLDMSDSTQNCPSGFRLYQSGGVRACGKPVLGASCVSVQFPSNGISYSQICGRVIGYQWGSPNGIDGVNDINSYYVDGVSITRGSPRQHVWTFLAEYTQSSCQCSGSISPSVRPFIGTHYFCESGNNGGASNSFYTSDPLWDGQGCGGAEGPCCNVPGIPWFHRDYGNTTTTDYIELRVCANYIDEDSPVSFYEIYVK